MKFDTDGKLFGVRIPAAMQQYGRLRAVTALPNGSLLDHDRQRRRRRRAARPPRW